MNKDKIYLDTYMVQKDMRIRLPKEILKIFNLSKGISTLDIFVDSKNNQIVLKPAVSDKEVKQNDKTK